MEETYINWNKPSTTIAQFISEMLTQGQVAKGFIRGKEILIKRVAFATDVKICDGLPGEILKMQDKNFRVKTKDGVLEIVQYEFNGEIRVGDRLTGIPTIIFGNYGVCKEVYWCIKRSYRPYDMAEYEVIGFVAENSMQIGAPVVDGKAVIASDETFEGFLTQYDKLAVVIPFGNAELKQKIYNNIRQYSKLMFPNIIDSSVICEQSQIQMGQGNIFAAGNVIAANLSMGNFNLVNMSCTIGHDVEIGSFNTINPQTAISGNVKIGDACLIGAASTILQGLIVGDQATVGAGAVVIKGVNSGSTVIGVPATEKIRERA